MFGWAGRGDGRVASGCRLAPPAPTIRARSAKASTPTAPRADYIYLGDRGITGNGHMMMMEKNSDAIAALLWSWLGQG
jgi:hypothetical protein